MFKDGKDYDINLSTVPTLGGGAKPGRRHSAETKRKIGDANRGKVLGPHSRELILKTTKLFYKGKTYKEWGEELGVTAACIRKRMTKNGNPYPYKTVKPPAKPRVFYKGLTIDEWSEKTGVKRTTVAKYLRLFGHPYSKAICIEKGLIGG